MQSKPASPTVPIGTALDRSDALASLMRRLQESKDRFACVSPSLPPALRAAVEPGPVDEAGWSLLAANAAVAAKLRHLLPTLSARLADGGWAAVELRVKIRGRS